MNALNDYPFYGHLALASSLVLTAGFALHLLLGSRSAAARELVWRSVFLVLFLLPLTWLFRPFGLLVEAAGLPPVVRGFPAGLSSTEVMSGVAWEEIPAPFPWALIGGAVWAAGAVLLLLRMAAGVIWQRRWKAGASPCADPTALALWREIDRSGKGTLLVSPDCRMPLTWGKFVILPGEAMQWNRGDLQAALRHEAAHMERGDWLYRKIGEIAAAVFWPHPLLWLARRLWHRTQEQSCDDAVLRAGTDPANYAELLCSAARSWTRPAAQAMTMAQPSSLEHRLRAVLDTDCPRSPCSPGWVKVSGLAIVLAFSATALGQKKEDGEKSGTKLDPPTPTAPHQSEPGEKNSLEQLVNARKILRESLHTISDKRDSLSKMSGDELIEACSKWAKEDETIQLFSKSYNDDKLAYARMIKSGFGKQHPKVIGVQVAIDEQRKILLTASANYVARLPAVITRIQEHIPRLEIKIAEMKKNGQ